MILVVRSEAWRAHLGREPLRGHFGNRSCRGNFETVQKRGVRLRWALVAMRCWCLRR